MLGQNCVLKREGMLVYQNPASPRVTAACSSSLCFLIYEMEPIAPAAVLGVTLECRPQSAPLLISTQAPIFSVLGSDTPACILSPC